MILRTTSHRARHKLHAALGRKPQYFWNWEKGGCFAEVTGLEADRILPIKGVTKTRIKKENLRECWS